MGLRDKKQFSKLFFARRRQIVHLMFCENITNQMGNNRSVRSVVILMQSKYYEASEPFRVRTPVSNKKELSNKRKPSRMVGAWGFEPQTH